MCGCFAVLSTLKRQSIDIAMHGFSFVGYEILLPMGVSDQWNGIRTGLEWNGTICGIAK